MQMKTIAGTTAFIVALVVLPSVYGATTASFDGGADTPSTLETFGVAPGPSYQPAGGNPGGYLQLTDAVNSQHNWATFDMSDAGTYPQSTFSFDFLLNPTATPSADGFSFSYANTANYGGSGGVGTAPFTAEDPAAAGVLGFGFDTWSNQAPNDNPNVPTGSDYQEISVFYNGALVQRIDDTRLLTTPLVLDDGVWHSVTGSVDFAGGAVSLSVDGQSVFNGVAIPGLVPFESRIMLAARTGGENELAGIDNINVQYVPEPVGCVLALTAFGILGLLRRRR
jgi:hypothetical protein